MNVSMPVHHAVPMLPQQSKPRLSPASKADLTLRKPFRPIAPAQANHNYSTPGSRGAVAHPHPYASAHRPHLPRAPSRSNSNSETPELNDGISSEQNSSSSYFDAPVPVLRQSDNPSAPDVHASGAHGFLALFDGVFRCYAERSHGALNALRVGCARILSEKERENQRLRAEKMRWGRQVEEWLEKEQEYSRREQELERREHDVQRRAEELKRKEEEAQKKDVQLVERQQEMQRKEKNLMLELAHRELERAKVERRLLGERVTQVLKTEYEHALRARELFMSNIMAHTEDVEKKGIKRAREDERACEPRPPSTTPPPLPRSPPPAVSSNSQMSRSPPSRPSSKRSLAPPSQSSRRSYRGSYSSSSSSCSGSTIASSEMSDSSTLAPSDADRAEDWILLGDDIDNEKANGATVICPAPKALQQASVLFTGTRTPSPSLVHVPGPEGELAYPPSPEMSTIKPISKPHVPLPRRAGSASALRPPPSSSFSGAASDLLQSFPQQERPKSAEPYTPYQKVQVPLQLRASSDESGDKAEQPLKRRRTWGYDVPSVSTSDADVLMSWSRDASSYDGTPTPEPPSPAQDTMPVSEPIVVVAPKSADVTATSSNPPVMPPKPMTVMSMLESLRSGKMAFMGRPSTPPSKPKPVCAIPPSAPQPMPAAPPLPPQTSSVQYLPIGPHDPANCLDLMYIRSEDETQVVCRACTVRYAGYPKDKPKPKIQTFPKTASWDVLRAHCVAQHPEACADVARLHPGEVFEIRKMLIANGQRVVAI